MRIAGLAAPEKSFTSTLGVAYLLWIGTVDVVAFSLKGTERET